MLIVPAMCQCMPLDSRLTTTPALTEPLVVPGLGLLALSRVGDQGQHHPAMTKRILAAMLWFYTGWYAGAMLAEVLGISPRPRPGPRRRRRGPHRGRPAPDHLEATRVATTAPVARGRPRRLPNRPDRLVHESREPRAPVVARGSSFPGDAIPTRPPVGRPGVTSRAGPRATRTRPATSPSSGRA